MPPWNTELYDRVWQPEYNLLLTTETPTTGPQTRIPVCLAHMDKFKTVARTVAAWIAVVLSLYVVFVIFSIWVLVPNDSIVSGPSPQLIRFKAEVTAASVTVALG